MHLELQHDSGGQLYLVQEDDEDDGGGGGKRMSGASFSSQRQVAGGGALWTELWEFASFEMQIPGRAERDGGTGVLRKCVVSGGGDGCEAVE